MLAECQLDAAEALRLQAAVGYGLEDTQMIIESMAQVRGAGWQGCRAAGVLWQGHMHACCRGRAMARLARMQAVG